MSAKRNTKYCPGVVKIARLWYEASVLVIVVLWNTKKCMMMIPAVEILIGDIFSPHARPETRRKVMSSSMLFDGRAALAIGLCLARDGLEVGIVLGARRCRDETIVVQG
jgi:hypothetical protein